MSVGTLFDQPSSSDMAMDQAAMNKYRKLKKDISDGKHFLFDSGRYIGRIEADAAAKFEARWETFIGWVEEYEALVKSLAAAGADMPRCRHCGELIFTAWQRSDKYCEHCIRPLHQRKLEALITEHGWAAIEARVLGGEVVIILKDESVKPEGYEGHVTYTLAELRDIRMSSAEMIRMVHRAKKHFGGRIEPETKTRDPRPDLTDDHKPWEELLTIAKDDKLYGPLHGFRCYGARLMSVVGVWNIVYDKSREGFESQREFDSQYSLYLSGKNNLRDMLNKIGTECGGLDDRLL